MKHGLEAMIETTARPQSSRLRPLLAVLLQGLPLVGLSGCTTLWTVVPISGLLTSGSDVAFWAFFGLAGLLAGASLCWGLGYLYLGQRERLGCALTLLGPLLVIWSYGYLFEGFRVALREGDEATRRQAMLWTLLLCAGPVLALSWDAWRRARAAPDPSG